jgi:hypothetical protein
MASPGTFVRMPSAIETVGLKRNRVARRAEEDEGIRW